MGREAGYEERVPNLLEFLKTIVWKIPNYYISKSLKAWHYIERKKWNLKGNTFYILSVMEQWSQDIYGYRLGEKTQKMDQKLIQLHYYKEGGEGYI